MTTLHNTLEQGKKLKELGVTESLHYHWEDSIIAHDWQHMYATEEKDRFPALNAGEMFKVIDWSRVSISAPYPPDFTWLFATNDKDFSGDSPTHLAADVLIYQLEQGIVTAEQVNDKLKQLK